MITRSDVETAVGSEVYNKLLDDDNDGQADTAVADQIIEDCKAMVYSKAAEILSLPSDADQTIQAKVYARHIAAFLVWSHNIPRAQLYFGGMPKSVELLYTNALRDLYSIARTLSSMTTEDGDSIVGDTQAVSVVPYREAKYTREYLDRQQEEY